MCSYPAAIALSLAPLWILLIDRAGATGQPDRLEIRELARQLGRRPAGDEKIGPAADGDAPPVEAKQIGTVDRRAADRLGEGNPARISSFNSSTTASPWRTPGLPASVPRATVTPSSRARATCSSWRGEGLGGELFRRWDRRLFDGGLHRLRSGSGPPPSPPSAPGCPAPSRSHGRSHRNRR